MSQVTYVSLFQVDIWGTVAEWVAAAGTVAAAFIAVGYYIFDSQRSKKSQARQVIATVVEHRGRVAIRIRNDSDRHITGFFITCSEKSLVKSLLKREHFDLHRIMRRTADGSIVHMTEKMASPERVLSMQKSELVGYGGGFSITVPGGDKRHLAAGQCYLFSTELIDLPFHSSTEFWIGFIDANGLMWQRQAIQQAIFDGVGKLCSVSDTSDFFPKERRKPIAGVKYYLRVFWWLYKYRKQTTASKLPWEEANDPSS
jgi:hypothetical protein